MPCETELSKIEAYSAMFVYLEEVFARTQSDDLGALLGGMSLLADGGTADPAAWADWEAAVRRVVEGEVDLELSLR